MIPEILALLAGSATVGWLVAFMMWRKVRAYRDQQLAILAMKETAKANHLFACHQLRVARDFMEEAQKTKRGY